MRRHHLTEDVLDDLTSIPGQDVRSEEPASFTAEPEDYKAGGYDIVFEFRVNDFFDDDEEKTEPGNYTPVADRIARGIADAIASRRIVTGVSVPYAVAEGCPGFGQREATGEEIYYTEDMTFSVGVKFSGCGMKKALDFIELIDKIQTRIYKFVDSEWKETFPSDIRCIAYSPDGHDISEINRVLIYNINNLSGLGKRTSDYRRLKDVVCMICGTGKDEFNDREFISELKKRVESYISQIKHIG